MARTLDNLYNLYQYILRKQLGVYQSPAEFTANLNMGQQDAYQEYFSLYGKDQIIHDALLPFKTYVQFSSNAAGYVSFPSNYKHLCSQPFTVYGSSVNYITFLTEDKYAKAITNQARAVTNEYPIAFLTVVNALTTPVTKGFSIYPQTTQIGAYWYLREPATPVYGYTQVGRVVTYSSAASTQLEWDDLYLNNILAKALKYAGVNMDENGIYEFANQYNADTTAT